MGQVLIGSGWTLLVAAVLTAGSIARAGTPGAQRTGAEAVASSPQAGGWFDLSNRAVVRDEYLYGYLPLRATPPGWTGNVDGCRAGETSAAYRAAVLGRVNYFRRMAGVPPIAAFDPVRNAQAQRGALMQSANRQVNSIPPPDWACFTPEGNTAIREGNLCYQGKNDNDPGCVDFYMKEDGIMDVGVARRRLLLFPSTLEMGTGDVPAHDVYGKANVLRVWDRQNWDQPRPATREEFVAWPPPGFVPKPVVYRRWSFGFPRADFSSATVEMIRGGAPVPLRIEPLAWYGDNSIVWAVAESFLEEVQDALTDLTVNVRVANVRTGSGVRDFQYAVSIFDPEVTNAPGTVPVRVTTFPPGLPVTVDGVTAASPRVFEWTPGSPHTLEVPAVYTTVETRATFVSWMPGGAARLQSVVAPAAPAIFNAAYDAQFRLTTETRPAEAGRFRLLPESPDGFYPANSFVYIDALANAGFRSVALLGDEIGTGGRSLRMDSPKSVIAVYSRQTVPVQFYTVPPGREIVVDGVRTIGTTFHWTPGSTHTIEADAVQDGQPRERFLFVSWSNQGARIQTITVPEGGFSFTVTYKRQFQLSLEPSPPYGGSIRLTPPAPDNFYDPGTVLTVEALPAAGYRVSGPPEVTFPRQYTVQFPDRIRAEFAAISGALVIFTTLAPVLFTIDGSVHSPPAAFEWVIGSTHAVEAPAEVTQDGTRYVFNRWSQGGKRAQTVTVTQNATYVAHYDVHYRLTRTANPPQGGHVTAEPPSPDGFYPAGTVVHVQAGANPGYVFTGFTGALGGVINPQTLTLSEARSVTAQFAGDNPQGSIPLRFVPVTPCRVADTRREDWRHTGFGAPAMEADQRRPFRIPQASCGIPAEARAYSLNVTVVPAEPLAYLTLWPLGLPQPLASTLNAFDGQVVANAAIVPAGVDGGVAVYVTGRTDVILDINGYFVP